MRKRGPSHWLGIGALLILALMGCRGDLCRDRPPAFEVVLALGPGVDRSRVRSMEVVVQAADLKGKQTFNITSELGDGETSLDVTVGDTGKDGFTARIGAVARDASDATVASAEQAFAASGDACNFFRMTLDAVSSGDGGPADGGLDGTYPQDQTPAETKPSKLDGPCPGTTCPLGCNAALHRCYRLRPSNFDPAPSYDGASGGLAFKSAQGSINTSTGEIKDGSTVLRAPGSGVKQNIYWSTVKQKSAPDLSVFGMAYLFVPPGATVVVTGKIPLALLVKGSATIAGRLVAAASKSSAGSGGFGGGSSSGKSGASCFGGEGQGGTGSPRHSGGGGGGRGGAGGKGGDGTGVSVSKGGAGGKPVGNTVLVPLFGGCGAGAGAGSGSAGGRGGGGGGALQISASGVITVTGQLLVPGAGGGSGLNATGGGGGGGAGGAILLEGASIKVTGILAANGGGGGAGCAYYHVTIPDGQDGQASTTAAKGGSSVYEKGSGGAGGARTSVGGSQGKSAYHAGGGGGARGRVHLNSPSISIGEGNASPSPSTSKTVGKW